MTERPILFSPPMVRALLCDEKTQTRRIVKPQPAPNKPHDGGTSWHFEPKTGLHVPWGTVIHLTVAEKMGLRCPYGLPGDRLWVREAWMPLPGSERGCLYRATDAVRVDSTGQWYGARDVVDSGGLGVPVTGLLPGPAPRWRPSIHMPRSHCRLLLDVLAVRVERLHDISEADARAEGCTARTYRDGRGHEPATVDFRNLWNTINGFWDSNPLVWVVTFRRVVTP